MGSSFSAKLCEQLTSILDEKSKTGIRIENWPNDPADDVPALRLCGAFHGITITNPNDPLAAIYRNPQIPDFSEILSRAIKTHDVTLYNWLDLPPQTNETGRAAVLLAGLLQISRQSKLPLQLCEIGSSAGLNLQLDRFHYSYRNTQWGNPNSPVKLKPDIKNFDPNIAGKLKIKSRIGCDLSPLDITDPHQQLRLRSYIWPDQPHRMQRLDGAIKLATANPVEIVKMDAAEFVEEQLNNRVPDTAFVLMHSIVWQYLPQSTKDHIENLLHKFGDKATTSNPVYWLRLEAAVGREKMATLLLDTWPNHSHNILANSCYHANWINFIKPDFA